MLEDARLGRILVESGRLSEEVLRSALEEQKRGPGTRPLSEILLARGLVSDADLRRITDHAAQYEPTAVVTPRSLGKFRIDAELGRGGMGVVYRAWQADLERAVALKMLPVTADPALKERFLREARTASRLRHPNIVAVHELGEHEGSAFFTMDYVKGEPFDAVLRRPDRRLEENVRVVAAVARALDYAHRQGVVHRDIKPGNILLDRDGTPFLTDFGLARDANVHASLTASGQILGTPAFMSPEQARGRGEVGAASDLYSLGAVLYVALAGTPPFSADSVYELLDAIIKRPPASPRLLRPGVPAALEGVCLRCLEKDPARRYGSASELADDLQRFLKGEPVAAPRPRVLGRRQAAATAGRRRPLALALVPVAGLLLVGIVLVPLLSGGPAGPPPPLPLAAPAPTSLFAVPDAAAPVGRRWAYAFASDAEAADWPLEPDVGRTNQSWDARLENGRLYLRNIEARFRAPLEGEGSIEADLHRAGPSEAGGLSYGGYRLLRERDRVTLRSPTGRAVSRSASEVGGVERLGLALGGGEAIVRLGGRELFREPLREPARPLQPALFAPDGSAARWSDVRLEGRLREGWIERAGLDREQFAEVGAKFGLGPALDLLEGGPTGRFQPYGSGRHEKTAEELRVLEIGGAAAELHGPDHRNARICFEYRTDPGAPYFGLRFRAGFRDVTVPLPADPQWRSVEVLALEHLFRCTLEGRFDVRSSMANGVEIDQRMLRLKVSGGGFAIRKATVEPIRDVPPQEPWTILYRDGAAFPGFEPGPEWKVEGPNLVGSGLLRSKGTFRDFEAEIIVTPSRPGLRLRVGLGGRPLIVSDPFLSEKQGGFDMRYRNGQVELENDAVYRRETVAAGLYGPFTIETLDAPAAFFCIRLRPLPP